MMDSYSLKQRAQELLRIAHLKWLARRFLDYRRRRQQRYGTDLSQLECPAVSGLVSIVLPVYNGADLLGAAIDSVLAQDYAAWELIIVNDGSQDATAAIATEYAQRDDRITVLHQENRKIPKTLSRGFRRARGQYLTWTSADNRLRPQFLRKMVDCLERHPDWDLIYANQDIIGDQGQPLRGSGYFSHLQSPPGSEHVHLPDRTELLHSDGNYVGAAFLYRNRVAHLLGDYSSQRFTVEDYDYWLLCDTLLQVAHVDFPEPVYEYRFHAGSLTARAKELRIAEARERLLVSDELRQEQCLRPLLWIWEDDDPARASVVLRALREQLSGLHHTLLSHRQIRGLALPRHFLPAIFFRLGSVAESQLPPPPDLPEGTLCGYLLRDANPSVTVTPHPQWQVVAAIGTGETPRLRPDSYQGLWRTDSIATLVRALDCRCRADALRRLEITTEQPTPLGSLTVLVDEAQGAAPLTTLLHSLAMQTLSRNQLEILIIRQARSGQTRQRLDSLRATCGDSFVSRLRLIDVPDAAATWSLSAAIAESSSELLCFLTAPPRTPDCLQQLVQTFVRHPELALLREPLPVADLPLYPWHSRRSFAARRKPLLEAGGLRSHTKHSAPDLRSEIVQSCQLQRLGYQVAESTDALCEHSHQANLRFLPTALRTVQAMLADSLRSR